MIVKCEQCQTRFKIPDDKVTDKGVKVRCTKCSHTFRVTRDMAQPPTTTATVPAFQMPLPPTPAAPAAADPFARFGAPPESPFSEVTRPGVFALGVEATKAPVPMPSPAYPQSAPVNQAVAHTSSSPFDFNSLRPPPASSPTVPAVPAYAPAPSAAPFDFSAVAPASTGAPAAFDFASFAAPAAPAPQPHAAPPPAPPSAPTQPNTAVLPAFDFGPPSAPAAPAFQASAPAAAPAFPSFGGPAAVTQQHQALPDSGAGADGFFASTESSASALPTMDDATARSMFDLPQARPTETLPDIPPPEPEPAPQIEKVTLAKVTPKAATAPLPVEEAPRRRGIVGIVVNVGIAAVLVLGLIVVGSAYLNEGKVSADSLSLENLKNTFAPNVEFVASDVSNGLYETRAGRSVFFVRGEIINHSGNTVKVVVKAELVEDGKVVRSGESWAGEPATPEEIFLIDGAEALDALSRRVEQRALVVPSDAAASFVVPFTEYPPDLKDFRVRVSARAVPVNPTAANP